MNLKSNATQRSSCKNQQLELKKTTVRSTNEWPQSCATAEVAHVIRLTCMPFNLHSSVFVIDFSYSRNKITQTSILKKGGHDIVDEGTSV